ncbi:sensor histidine kinase [Smaragdicoccus niigatensis]|uniref:sensor histidine kinase n=1 Tax=Smaragdicoccus niigatensis TaxID=359359 RepID=UPI0003772F9E|nr:sensor histidine kinase KdpD [Smaragdicoccus niigatensis]
MQPKPRRGELRIYLGAAPGVGKTYAMLGEAHRRRERGTDVVIGLVETHGRSKTAEMVQGLEVVPRHTVRYRGIELDDMDIDAILARKPEVAVVDELAHTNAPGSRNKKRWQDIEELLDAGIDVLSTVNIQHLESLNDVVERITGVEQHETVPDEVVRRAEQIEIVDITPEALRRRLAHGNVYAAHKIDAALSNYFRLGNLGALREIALLWVADQVDTALQKYRGEQDITETWEARERVVVAITGGPESETLIRRARRIAQRSSGDLLVVHVMRGDGLQAASPESVTKCRQIADDLGASFHSIVGDDVPRALLDFAQGVNATQVVLGTSRRSRLARLFDEGIGTAVIQRSGAIDIHMVTHEESRRGIRWDRSPGVMTRARRLSAWFLALVAPGLVTVLGVAFPGLLNYASDIVAMFLAIVLVALLGGVGPAVSAALIGAVLLNYYFTPPIHTFTVSEPENLLTLVVMLIVAVLVALVVDRAARLAVASAQARNEAALLGSYARTVLADPDPLPNLLEKVRENFGQSCVALYTQESGDWTVIASAGSSPPADPGEADIDIAVSDDVHLALVGKALPAVDHRLVEAAAGQALLALRQQRLAADSATAQRQVETNQLRTALLSAVGHDLRTPLTSIKAAIGSLRDPSLRLSPGDVSELQATVEESADRLAALVANLLDSSRLATGAVVPQMRPITYDEAVGRALRGIDVRQSVRVEVDETLPAVNADPGLLERVIANLIDNALRHGQRADRPTEVAVRASEYGDTVELRVVDRGLGLPKNAAEQLFAPFQRLGDRDSVPGLGLGLSVAKGFVEAMGGTISAEDTPGGGLTMVVSLPVAS